MVAIGSFGEIMLLEDLNSLTEWAVLTHKVPAGPSWCDDIKQLRNNEALEGMF